MIRIFQRAMAVAIVSLPLLGTVGLAPAAADTPAQSASIVINDSGFSPRSATVFLNGSVSFTNSGSVVHTATTTGSAPLPFDTGGLNPGQSTSFNLNLPGTYAFDSATDCLNGNSSPQFKCGGGVVTVVASSAAASSSSAPAPGAPAASVPAPAAATAPGAAAGSAVVNVDDKGFSPASVTVALGGSVTWVNQSATQVHTATTTGDNPVPFDTGGLGPGQSGTFSFATAGTYSYNSAIDCGGSRNPAFGCGPYTVIVSGTPAPPASASGAPVVSNTNISINANQGFVPNTLTIRAGQTVTWTNSDTNVHTVTSNAGYTPAFDSGGLATGQKFSFQFNQPGTYGYHSQTEPVYTTDANTGNVTISYQLNGTIVVQ